jgi:hypothetical protein
MTDLRGAMVAFPGIDAQGWGRGWPEGCVLRERALVRRRAGVLSFWEEGEPGGILSMDCTTVSIQQYSLGEILVIGCLDGYISHG